MSIGGRATSTVYNDFGPGIFNKRLERQFLALSSDTQRSGSNTTPHNICLCLCVHAICQSAKETKLEAKQLLGKVCKPTHSPVLHILYTRVHIAIIHLPLHANIELQRQHHH